MSLKMKYDVESIVKQLTYGISNCKHIKTKTKLKV